MTTWQAVGKDIGKLTLIVGLLVSGSLKVLPCAYMPIAIAEINLVLCTAQRRTVVRFTAPQDMLHPGIPLKLSAIASVIKRVNAIGNVTSL